MGIKNLNKFLQKECPNVFEYVSIDKYSYQKIAVDASIYVCTFKMKQKHYFAEALLTFIAELREYNVHPIFVFDGKPPKEKMEEKKARAKQRESQEARIKRLEKAIENYNILGIVDEELKHVYQKQCKKQRLLIEDEDSIDIEQISKYVKKSKNNLFDITEQDFNLLKIILNLLNVPWIQAESEAETLCAQLAKQNLVKAVLTKDTDILACGAPIMLSNYHNYYFTQIKLDKILTDLNLNMNSWVDFCIMCGTDYNKNIQKIGPHGAYKLIKKYKIIDNIESENTEILNHKRVKELFTDNKIYEKIVPYSSDPNYKDLKQWMFDNNIKLQFDQLKNKLNTNIVLNL